MYIYSLIRLQDHLTIDFMLRPLVKAISHSPRWVAKVERELTLAPAGHKHSARFLHETYCSGP